MIAIIGIDLVTSNLAATMLRGGRPAIIPSAEGVSIGDKAFPSYVALTADEQTLVGELRYWGATEQKTRLRGSSLVRQETVVKEKKQRIPWRLSAE